MGKKLIENFPEYKEALQLLIDNAIGGAPVLTSDIFRLIAMPFADPKNGVWNGKEKIRYAYLDVDTFLDRMKKGPEDLVCWLTTSYEKVGSNVVLGGLTPSVKKDSCQDGENCELRKSYVNAKDFCNIDKLSSIWNGSLKIEINVSKGKSIFSPYVEKILEAQDAEFLSQPTKFYNHIVHGLSGDGYAVKGLKSYNNFKKGVIGTTGPGFLEKFYKNTEIEGFAWAFELVDKKVSYLIDKADVHCENSWLPCYNMSKFFTCNYAREFWAKKGIEKIDQYVKQ
ncbi:MAG: hypothetical protein ACRCYZ_04360 [Alphaproteobacteria bacterium]